MWILAKSTKQARRILCRSVGIAIVFLSTSLRLAAQSSFFDQSNVSRIADDIEKQKKEFLFPKVLVLDFPFSATGIENLSSSLADDLSRALETRLPPGTVISRTKLHDFLLAQRLSPSDLSSPSVALWVGDNLDANEILTGDMTSTDSSIGLSLALLRVSDAKLAMKWSLAAPLTPELKSQMGKRFEWQIPANPLNAARGCTTEASKAFIEAGGTPANGIRMTNPPLSEEARKEKLSGRRQYDVFVDQNGNPVLIIPHRPLKPVFDETAIETIKTWQFQPATLNGKPVGICVVIEINWRMY